MKICIIQISTMFDIQCICSLKIDFFAILRILNDNRRLTNTINLNL